MKKTTLLFVSFLFVSILYSCSSDMEELEHVQAQPVITTNEADDVIKELISATIHTGNVDLPEALKR